MQYDWYEIVGMGVLVGIIVFLVFRGLDMALERLLKLLADRRDRRLSLDRDSVPRRGTFEILWNLRRRG